jgi:hypothetical protein
MPSSSSLSLQKHHFLTNNTLTTSDGHLEKIKHASNHLIPFIKSFEEISKNDGLAFLFLDPSETHLQLLHHGTVLGGTWNAPSKQDISILGKDGLCTLFSLLGIFLSRLLGPPGLAQVNKGCF